MAIARRKWCEAGISVGKFPGEPLKSCLINVIEDLQLVELFQERFRNVSKLIHILDSIDFHLIRLCVSNKLAARLNLFLYEYNLRRRYRYSHVAISPEGKDF